jgi:CRISPR-associated protein Csm4
MELRRYRLLLDAASPFGTPPTSGTLFGHLAWAKRRREGRVALQAWLARLPAEPFALSDLLPADHLPRPLLAPAASVGTAEDAKALKRRRYLSLAAWRQLRAGATSQVLQRLLCKPNTKQADDDPHFLRGASLPHNRIDRATGRTPAAGGGGLWFAEELWPEVDGEGRKRHVEADLYIRSALPTTEVEALLAEVGETGFGRDAALGRGRFRLEGSEAMAWLDQAPAAGGVRRHLSLSQGVVTANMRSARWQRFVLFGKLGREMTAESKRPWKLPLLLAEAGATFAADDPGPFGAWITGLHQDDDPADPIGHNAFHLAIPYTEAAP